MQQTLLALCAILVFSIYALSRHRADARVERDGVGGEVEMLVTEQARALLTRALALHFDEADIGATQVRTDTAGLSGAALPRHGRVLGPDAGESATNPATFDDLDDWHGYTTTAAATWDAGQANSTVRLTSEVAVRYVNPLSPTTGAAEPTLAKEVTVTVREAVLGQGRPPVTAVLRQVVTPASSFR